jgi:hypothetical protein
VSQQSPIRLGPMFLQAAITAGMVLIALLAWRIVQTQQEAREKALSELNRKALQNINQAAKAKALTVPHGGHALPSP